MYELSVVIPVLNERDNIDPLLARLDRALAGIGWEAIFVDDDSTDGTADHLRALSARRPNLRVIQRIGRRGLASACVEGMLASAAPFLAVMDADLQHDETLLPAMLAALATGDLDIAVGSRFADGGAVGEFAGGRRFLSKIARLASRAVVRAELMDPMSGFFMLRRGFFDATVRRLSCTGFKILLDLFASADRPVRFRELPYRFGVRRHGVSKLDLPVALEYITLVGDKLIGHLLPIRFVVFVLVGMLGVLVHLAVLAVGFRLLGYPFHLAQAAATLIAMTSNFFFNNRITYYDRRLRGLFLWRGLASFYVACAIGAFINFQIAEFLFDRGVGWMIAGALGAVVGAVWNYGVTSTFTWRSQARPPPGA